MFKHPVQRLNTNTVQPLEKYLMRSWDSGLRVCAAQLCRQLGNSLSTESVHSPTSYRKCQPYREAMVRGKRVETSLPASEQKSLKV